MAGEEIRMARHFRKKPIGIIKNSENPDDKAHQTYTGNPAD